MNLECFKFFYSMFVKIYTFDSYQAQFWELFTWKIGKFLKNNVQIDLKNLRRPGIEPGSQEWESCMIPLHQRRYNILWNFLIHLKLRVTQYNVHVWKLHGKNTGLWYKKCLHYLNWDLLQKLIPIFNTQTKVEFTFQESFV